MDSYSLLHRRNFAVQLSRHIGEYRDQRKPNNPSYTIHRKLDKVANVIATTLG